MPKPSTLLTTCVLTELRTFAGRTTLKPLLPKVARRHVFVLGTSSNASGECVDRGPRGWSPSSMHAFSGKDNDDGTVTKEELRVGT